MKSFLSSPLRRIAARGRLVGPSLARRRTGELNAEKVSAEISFATGVQSAWPVIRRLCSNGMGSVRAALRNGRVFLLTAAAIK